MQNEEGTNTTCAPFGNVFGTEIYCKMIKMHDKFSEG
jgi:hypothetical protein